MSDVLECDFCAHRCRLKPGQTGICGIRKNDGGSLVTLGYGDVVALNSDPIEKKPLFHFHPGRSVYSVALFGCNFRCPFCQNAEIAFPEFRTGRGTRHIQPDEFVHLWQQSGDPGVAFTYSEPSVWQDYMLDVARKVKKLGGWTVMVTNGYVTPEATDRLAEVIDAFNIDLKGDDQFYRRTCHGRYGPVVETIRSLAPRRHLEVTSLFIEGIHTQQTIDGIGRELEDAGVQVWHITRFHPAFRMMDHAPTSEATLKETLEKVIGRFDIPFIYGGNSRQLEYQQTRCPNCDTVVMERSAFSLQRNTLVDGRCPKCGQPIYGVFDD